jgi:hypothetical protein
MYIFAECRAGLAFRSCKRYPRMKHKTKKCFWTMKVHAEFVKCEKDFRSILNNLELVLGELSRQQLIFVVLDIAMKRCKYGATMNKSNTLNENAVNLQLNQQIRRESAKDAEKLQYISVHSP